MRSTGGGVPGSRRKVVRRKSVGGAISGAARGKRADFGGQKRQTAPVSDVRSGGKGRGYQRSRSAGGAITEAAAGRRVDFGKRKVKRVKPLTGSSPAGLQAAGLIQPFRKSKLNKRIEAGEVIAPGLELLKELGRPVSGISRGWQAAVLHGGDPKKSVEALVKGFVKNDSSFGKVLKEEGVPKEIAAPVGFVADVAADPTTYLSLGIGSGVRKAALAAGEEAASKAAKAGLDKAAQEAARKRAVKQFVKPHLPKNATPEQAARHAKRVKDLEKASKVGLKVKFGGAEVPGVRRATARLSGGAEAPGGARGVAHELNPRVAIPGASKRSYGVVRGARRRARGESGVGVREGENVAHSFAKLSRADQEIVRNAVESGKVGRYLRSAGRDDLAKYANSVKAEVKYQRRMAVRRGVALPELQTSKQVTRRAAAKLAAARTPNPTGRDIAEYLKQAEKQAGKVEESKRWAQGFVPRKREADIQGTAEKPDPLIPESVGRNPNVAAKKTRKRREKMVDRPADGEPMSNDLALLMGNYIGGLGKARGRAVVNRSLLDAGRELRKVVVTASGKVKRSWEDPQLKPGEAVYRVHSGGRIEAVSGKVPKSGAGASGRFVVLPKDLVEYAKPEVQFAGKGSSTLRGFDAFQGKWKHLAILTPQYQARNLLGDMTNHYLASRPDETLRVMRTATGATKALNRRERALVKEGGRGRIKPVDRRGFKTKNGERITPEQLASELRDLGVTRAGQVGGELPQLRKAGAKADFNNPGVTKVRQRGFKTQRAGRMFSETREDTPRALTYAVARLRGMTPEEAASRVTDFHFDYRELSMVERDFLRRFMPFYTFSARNIPLQTRRIVQRPGKYANIEKLRRESEVAGGAGTEWQDAARNLDRIGVKLPGGKSWDTYLSEYDKRGQPLAAVGRAIGFQPPTTDISVLGSGILAAAHGNPKIFMDELIGRTGQMLGPYKTPFEIYVNKSLFFRGDVQNPRAPLAPAPSWVVHLPKSLKDYLHVVDDRIDRRTGKASPGWPASVDYALRTANPGIIGFLNNLATARERRNIGTAETIAGFLTGVKTVKLDKTTVYAGAMGILFNRLNSVQEKAGASGQTVSGQKRKKALNKEAGEIQRQINEVSKLMGFKKPLFEPGGSKKKPASGFESEGGSSGGYEAD